MGQFVYFTQGEKARANQVDLVELLRCRGEKLIPSGREKRLASNHSITVRGNAWFDHATGQGGHAIKFVQTVYGLRYPEAVSLLLGGPEHIPYPAAAEQQEEPPKPFVLPPPFANSRRVMEYLTKTRCIDSGIASAFAGQGLLYEDTRYHNVVFVGKDEHGIPRHAHRRSIAGKRFCTNVAGSLPQYSFHFVGSGNQFYVFEAPIDLLSYLSLHPRNWQECSYVALCGVSGKAMHWMLRQYPALQEIVLCLDHDAAGHNAANRLAKELQEAGYQRSILLPERKDWNDDLTTLRT